MTKARDELREKISAIELPIPKGAKALPRLLTLGEFLADSVADEILSQVDTYVKGIIGKDVEPITPEKYNELYSHHTMKDDAAIHYKNKGIVANNKLRSEQRKRAGLEDE